MDAGRVSLGVRHMVQTMGGFSKVHLVQTHEDLEDEDIGWAAHTEIKEYIISHK